jgi:hypothetical protein
VSNTRALRARLHRSYAPSQRFTLGVGLHEDANAERLVSSLGALWRSIALCEYGPLLVQLGVGERSSAIHFIGWRVRGICNSWRLACFWAVLTLVSFLPPHVVPRGSVCCLHCGRFCKLPRHNFVCCVFAWRLPLKPNKRIKAVRFAHSTTQELRSCVALYSWR